MNRKQMMIGGGALILVLAFLWYRRQQAAAGTAQPTDTAGTAQDQASSDYATLAGMLQQQQAQEASDIAGLGAQITGLGAGAGGIQGPPGDPGIAGQSPDLSGFQSTIDSLTGQVAAQTRTINSQHKSLVSIMAGEKRQAAAIKKLQHPKAGVKHKPTSNPHANQHHPAGTAGHSVGQRSHQPKTPTVHRPTGGVSYHAPPPKPKPKPKPKGKRR